MMVMLLGGAIRAPAPMLHLEREFQLEPIPEQVTVGQRLLLSCQPPRGKPTPSVSASCLQPYNPLSFPKLYSASLFPVKEDDYVVPRSDHPY
ncbi:unnamed protein product [Dibothriocephalus latus]|uniref:Ig-like domain-containing protein n=1 Tax=Dibothriocephalus latus TaxID=60516 RepID=A0A3P7LUC0_DIBLA|nr:unnamed protein product [Dibothriocephalus latus]